MEQDNFTFFYSGGVIETYIIEGSHVSIEFFPEGQSKGSFESAEYNNIFKIDTIINNIDTVWNTPSISKDELKEYRECLMYFIRNKSA